MKYDVIIIGSGLGGLECGYILSKQGYNVCILEKNPQLGGCLQTFRRGKMNFDTGFHYVGGLDEGQSLYRLFRYFQLLNLPWQRMDENGFAEIILKDKSYFFASGYEHFTETLSRDFPHQDRQLKRYALFLKNVGENTLNNFTSQKENEFSVTSLFERSAYSFLQQTIDDPLLRNVLSGASLTMELCAEKLPLYVFAQINSSFIQSAWRLKGGGSLIARELAQSIRRMGGSVLTNAKVTQIVEQNGLVTGVQYNGEEQVEGKYVISDIHPALTLALIPESRYIRKIYRKRITDLPNTCGMFTTHLQLKPNKVAYRNRNIYLYKNQNPWDCGYSSDGKTSAALFSYQPPESDGVFTDNIDVLTPMHWAEMAQWADTSVGKRGKDYTDFKNRKAEECIGLALETIPELNNNIERFYTSTPLTYRDYTGTWEGSAYGMQKDYNHLLSTLLSVQTQLPNLFLTGQNLNLHGILGVSITSFLSCAKITGMETLIKDLNQ
ncbi:MAG: NAD(P)/FAD-dependent oxidoreductase [Bacteroidales bacterium]|jgi:all-trans-retinol 13,14-reductase|nr:NAD(P)/FAD-dependent oxidoreductase [Bacteroidales bacterium]